MTAIDATVSPAALLDQLNWRYAVKQFDPTRAVADDVWAALEQSLVLAPSSFGLQPWKFWVIQDRDLRQQLQPHAWGQSQVVDCSHLVVLTIRQDLDAADVDRYIARMAEVRNTTVEELQGFANVVKNFLKEPPYPLDINAWSTRQVYIALGQLMTSAALLGVDTCPIEGFNPAEFDRILQLPEQGYHAVVLCAVGYRSAEDKYATMPKVRFLVEDMIERI